MGEAWAILLAAGESSRMGQLKALLPWRGQPLLRHQVSALRAGGAAHVVVVLGHRPEELSPLLDGIDGVDWVLNPDYLQGKTTSIKAGLSAVNREAVDEILLLNVDQPRSAADIARILDTHRAGVGSVTIPTCGGKGGHPIALSAELLDELMAIDEESLGVKAVVQRRPESVNRFPLENPEILLDLNTPDQYRMAVETFAA